MITRSSPAVTPMDLPTANVHTFGKALLNSLGFLFAVSTAFIGNLLLSLFGAISLTTKTSLIVFPCNRCERIQEQAVARSQHSRRQGVTRRTSLG